MGQIHTVNQNELLDLLLDQSKWTEKGLDPSKGFILMGKVGVGKTYAMHKFAETQKIGWGHPKLPFIYGYPEDSDIKSVEYLCAKHGSDYLKTFTLHDMYIDDLGTEVTYNKNYGTDLNLGMELLTVRHKIKDEYKTYITTNYPPDLMIERYTERVWSRLQEMCNVIIVTGKDLRK